MNYETREVLAGAYKGKDISERPRLTHVVEIDERDREVRVLCRIVRLDSLCDRVVESGPTCPRCAAALEKILGSGFKEHGGRGSSCLCSACAFGRDKLRGQLGPLHLYMQKPPHRDV